MRSPRKRFEGIASQISSRFIIYTFFKHFAITVQNTKNRSIRKAFQYKSTIKPVIICVLHSLKHFNFTKPICKSNVDFETAAISPLDKTTSCPRNSIFSPILRVLIRRRDLGTSTRIHKSQYLPTFKLNIKKFTSSVIFCPATLL